MKAFNKDLKQEFIAWLSFIAYLPCRSRLIGCLTSHPIDDNLIVQSPIFNKTPLIGIHQKEGQPHDVNILAASACDVLICNPNHYAFLCEILAQQNKPKTIILTHENWLPDWCWIFHQHHFLCRQDLVA
ncbi:hypothetical protein KFZ68_05780 [Photobacterium damselae]|uniref:hypothetical protein n=1 Tax=Photobacterium damselae TaxID=38293 RepID=UPI002542C9B5